MTAPRRLAVQYGGIIGALLVAALLAVSTVEEAVGRDPLHPQRALPGQVVSDAATPDPTPTATRKPAASRDKARTAPTGSAWTEQVRACIVHRESRGDYRARRTDGGTASGAYAFIDRTWRNVTGRTDSAWQAPKAVQDAAFYTLWDGGKGRSHWNPDAPGVTSCW